jgi:hypothetical protein
MDGSLPGSEDLYGILGVDPDASTTAIRGAYRSLARRIHPDVQPRESDREFKRLAAAYEILADEHRRREYDRTRLRPVPTTPPRNGPTAVRRAPGPTGNVETRGPAAIRRPAMHAERPVPAPRAVRTEADEWRTLSRLTKWLIAAVLVMVLALAAMVVVLARDGDGVAVEPGVCRTPDGWVDCKAVMGP